MIAAGMRALSAELRGHGKHITIETAGTVRPEGVACDLASISPKLANSTPRGTDISPGWVERHERLRFQPEVIREWIDNYEYQLKFVVEDADDLEEIRGMLGQVGGEIPPWKVMLMPQGIDLETLGGREDFVVEACKTHGYRYCSRLHIQLFGHTRGT